MNKRIIYTTLFLLVELTSCQTTRVREGSVAENRIDEIVYKDFKGNRFDFSGIAKLMKYYENEKLIKVQYFDLNNELARSQKSWQKQNAEWRFEYDEKGNFIKQIAYDFEGRIYDVVNWGNSAIEILKYNNKGELIEKSNYDKGMNLIGLGDIGDAQTKYGYNENGQLIWKKSYNQKSDFIKNGYCYSKYEYNENGKLRRHAYYYDSDRLNQYSLYYYDEDGISKEETFDNQNKKTGYEYYKYNDSGDMISIEKWYYKWEEPIVESNSLVLNLEGWKIRDADKNKLEFSFKGKGDYSIKM